MTDARAFGLIALVLIAAVLPQEIHAGAMLVTEVVTVVAAGFFAAVAAGLVKERQTKGES